MILGADLSNGGLIDAGEGNAGPDVARIEGPSILGKGSSPITSAATSLSSHAERNPSDCGICNILTPPDIFSNQTDALAPLLNSLRDYRMYT